MNWTKKYKFSDLYDLDSGISSKPEQAGHGSPFLSFSTVFNNYFLPASLPDLMDTSEKERKKYSIKEGDIFLTRTSETLDELGMSSVAIKDYPDATYSGFLKRLRPKQTNVTYPKFMAFYLRSELFRKSMRNNAIMTLRASFNEQIFSYLDLLLPEYDEQVKIGDFLYSTIEKTEINNKINAELEAMAKLIYDYWFVQFDFPISAATAASMGQPELEGKPYKASGGPMVYNKQLKREIPEGWEDGVLGDLLTNISINIEPQDFPDLPYLPIDKLPTEKLYYQEYEDRNQAQSSLIKFNEDDILLGAMRVYFHRVCNAIEDGISRSTMISLRAKESHLKNYALFTLNRKEAILYATKHSTGTSIPYAKWSNSLEKYRICIPKDELVINRFNNLIDPILDKFKVLAKENQKLSELRDWLLPMLMNGQVSIKEAEEYPDSYRESMAAEPREGYGD